MYVSGPYISHVLAPLSNLIPISFPNLFFSVESKAISSFLTFFRISSNLRLISISVYALGLLSFFFFILIYLIDITF